MEEIFLSKPFDKRIKEIEKRISPLLKQEEIEKAREDFISLFGNMSLYESFFKIFNENLKYKYEMSNKGGVLVSFFYPKGRNYVMESLNALARAKSQYEEKMQDVIKTGLDVSGLKGKLNYLEILN